jgi:hypothetical protein
MGPSHPNTTGGRCHSATSRPKTSADAKAGRRACRYGSAQPRHPGSSPERATEGIDQIMAEEQREISPGELSENG